LERSRDQDRREKGAVTGQATRREWKNGRIKMKIKMKINKAWLMRAQGRTIKEKRMNEKNRKRRNRKRRNMKRRNMKRRNMKNMKRRDGKRNRKTKQERQQSL